MFGGGRQRVNHLCIQNKPKKGNLLHLCLDIRGICSWHPALYTSFHDINGGDPSMELGLPKQFNPGKDFYTLSPNGMFLKTLRNVCKDTCSGHKLGIGLSTLEPLRTPARIMSSPEDSNPSVQH